MLCLTCNVRWICFAISCQKNKNDYIHSIFLARNSFFLELIENLHISLVIFDFKKTESYSRVSIDTYVCDVIESTGEKLFTNIVEINTNDNISGDVELIPE